MQVLKPIAALVLAGLLIGTPAQAQDAEPNVSTPTTLYFHIFDTFNRFVINTQPMNVEFFEVGGTNNPTVAELGWDQNTIYGYSTAGPVEYDFIENGRPRIHPERGIASDVILDGAAPAVAYVYLDVRDVMGLDSAPNALPELTFRVTVQEGDNPGRDADYDVGKDIMLGEATVQVADTRTAPAGPVNGAVTYAECLLGCYPPPEEPVEDDPEVSDGNAAVEQSGTGYMTPDESGIIEIPIEMNVLAESITKKDAYNVRIDWYQAKDQFGEDAFSTGYFRLAADQDHLPRLEFNIMNPIYIEFLHPQVAAGTLLIHAGVNSPWGTYDVDTDSLELTVKGPQQPKNLRMIASTNEHVHGLHDQAAQITYLWDFREEGAPEGEYTISLDVQNNGQLDADGNSIEGTKVTATETATFLIEGKNAIGFDQSGEEVEPSALNGDEKESPAAGSVAALALLGAALILRRRTA